MLIEINDEIARNERALTNLINLVDMCNGQHAIGLSSPDVENTIIETLGSESITYSFFRELVEKASFGFDFQKTIVFSSTPVDGVSHDVKQMYEILTEKAEIILENKNSDLKFIKMVLHSTKAIRLLELYRKAWEANSNGGCGEIPKLIDESCSVQTKLKRVFVVHDSDKFYPQSALGAAQRNIVSRCRDHDIVCVTLTKREIENYIPDNLIYSITNSPSNFKQTWGSLSLEQKSHYDFKKGFRDKPHCSPEYGGLYRGLCAGQDHEHKSFN